MAILATPERVPSGSHRETTDACRHRSCWTATTMIDSPPDAMEHDFGKLAERMDRLERDIARESLATSEAFRDQRVFMADGFLALHARIARLEGSFEERSQGIDERFDR